MSDHFETYTTPSGDLQVGMLSQDMFDAICSVQRGLNKIPNYKYTPENARAIGVLCDINMALGHDPVIEENPIPDALTIARTEPYPKTPIVEHLVLSIVDSRIICEDSKTALLGTWVKAASYGEGRTYPTRGIARIALSQIVEQHYPDSTRSNEIRRIIDKNDRERPFLGPFLRACDLMRAKLAT